MESMEQYWEMVAGILGVMNIGIDSYCFCRFVRPYLQKHKAAEWTGGTFFAVMLILYLIPFEMTSTFAYLLGAAASFAVMILLDHRNVEQKLFLTVTIYLLRWIAGGINLIPRSAFLEVIPYEKMGPGLQLGVYTVIELLLHFMSLLVMLLLITIINKRYHYKKENLNKRELTFLIVPPLSVLVGYWIVTFLVNAYEYELKQNIWVAREEYKWLLVLYQGVSYAAILTVIIAFEKLKESRREEKEKAVLSGQIEDLQRHIGEVEKLYRDIRSLKHDMGNHVMTLEKLYNRKEYGEAGQYIAQLRNHLEVAELDIKSGNPVTDVILTEKKKEAEEKNIAFACSFYFPEGSKINAFDVSVILNNGITNAIEGAVLCENPYVNISSDRNRNAYLIKIENSQTDQKPIEKESGLPLTSKADRLGHGYGLANIRKVAQKYQGDIDITQDNGNFTLSILLMAE